MGAQHRRQTRMIRVREVRHLDRLEERTRAARVAAPAGRRRSRARSRRAADALGGFLRSKQGQRLEKEVVRGVFGLLKKRL
jgi:hypothetical protein